MVLTQKENAFSKRIIFRIVNDSVYLCNCLNLTDVPVYMLFWLNSSKQFVSFSVYSREIFTS